MRLNAVDVAFSAYADWLKRGRPDVLTLGPMPGEPMMADRETRAKYGRQSYCPADPEFSATMDSLMRPFHEDEKTKVMRGHGVMSDPWSIAQTVDMVIHESTHPKALSSAVCHLWPVFGLYAVEGRPTLETWVFSSTYDPKWDDWFFSAVLVVRRNHAALMRGVDARYRWLRDDVRARL